MTNETFKALEYAKIIRTYKCSKKEYEESDEVLRVSDNPEIDGYRLYEYIDDDDDDDLRLLLFAKLVGHSRSIRSILIYFQVLSIISIITGLIWIFTTMGAK